MYRPLKNINNIGFPPYSGARFEGPKATDLLTSGKEVITGDLRMISYPDAPIINFFKVDDNFFRGAQPGALEDGYVTQEKLEKDLTFLRDKCGVRTIINLRCPGDFKEQDVIGMEKRTVESLNCSAGRDKQIKFVNIQTDMGKGISHEQGRAICNVLAEEKGPFYAHCREGKDRTGVTGAIYRALYYPKTSFYNIFGEMRKCGHDLNGIFWGAVFSLVNNICEQPVLQNYRKDHREEINRFIKINQNGDSEEKKAELLEEARKKGII